MDSSSDHQDEDASTHEHSSRELPVRRRVDSGLVDVPRKRIEATIEQGADVYFGICRRIAEFLNRGND